MAERSWIPALLVTAALAMQTTPVVHAARLELASLSGWTAYVHAIERRLTRELADGRRFLGIDLFFFTNTLQVFYRIVVGDALEIEDLASAEDGG